MVPLAALALACATARPPETRERAAGYATPEPDPALAQNVQRAPLVDNLGQVSVRVRASEHRLTRLEVLAPELTAAQAEEMRRAFADCVCRPAEGGVATYVVTIGR